MSGPTAARSGAVLKHLQWMQLRGLAPITVYHRVLCLRRLAAHLDVEWLAA